MPKDTKESDAFLRIRRRLKAWRKGNGLTGREVFEKTGISATFWSDLENGPKRPDLANARLIEAFTGGEVRADEWLTDEERRNIAAAERAAQTLGEAKGAA